jgi:hypothetical protein
MVLLMTITNDDTIWGNDDMMNGWVDGVHSFGCAYLQKRSWIFEGNLDDEIEGGICVDRMDGDEDE